jgi:hypothetical protein
MLLALPAGAAAEPTIRYDDGATSDTVVVGAGPDALDLVVTWRYFVLLPNAQPSDHVVTTSQPFLSLPAQCTDEGDPALTTLDCEPPADFTRVTGSAEADTISASCLAFRGVPIVTDAIFIVSSGAGDDEVSSGCGATIDLGTGNDVASVRIGASTIAGGAGADDIRGGSSVDALTGAAGNDRIAGGGSSDGLAGGEGNDVLDGGSLRDRLDGGPGRDLLIGGPENDVIDGGEGPDTVSYEDKGGALPLSITLNGIADDGEPGENDRIQTTVENVIGSPGADTIVGDGGFNAIDGGDGGDVIDPGPGTDVVEAGAGNDRVRTRDGAPDQVECGAGDDLAITDAFDRTSGCESIDPSRELMADVDDDGVPAPADCADREPAIRPGVPDIADNAIDENCDGADAIDLDRDDDGAARPTDCDDTAADIRPGLPDRPGNGVDENCEGGDLPFPRVLTPVQSGFRAFADGTTTLTRLRIVDVPAGAIVELRCRGGRAAGCFKGVRRRRSPQGVARMNLLKLARSGRFEAPAVLEVRVLLADAIGKVVTFTMRKGKVPVSRTLCIVPGGTPRRRC